MNGWVAFPVALLRALCDAIDRPTPKPTYAQGFYDGYAAGVAEAWVEAMATRLEAE